MLIFEAYLQSGSSFTTNSYFTMFRLNGLILVGFMFWSPMIIPILRPLFMLLSSVFRCLGFFLSRVANPHRK
jgi:hypothetical protein